MPTAVSRPGVLTKEGEMIILIVVAVIVSSVFVPFALLGRAAGHRQRALVMELCDQLSSRGIDAALIPDDSPEALEQGAGTLRRLISFFVGGDSAYIWIEGMNYDLVTVRATIRSSESSRAGFLAFDLYSSHRESGVLRYHYVVRTGPVDQREFNTELKKKTEGLIFKQIVSVSWSGGGLATILNSQTKLNEAITRLLTPKDGLRVKYDRRNEAVRIILARRYAVQEGQLMGEPWAEPSGEPPLEIMLDVINRIAGLVRQHRSGAGSS